MRCQGASLRLGRVGLKARTLTLSTDGEGGLSAEEVEGSVCACADDEPLVKFTASAARVAPGGHRLHLTWPIARIGGVPVLPLPYLALPLARGLSGLFPPEVGYSGRDGVRLHQAAYLALPGDRMDLWARAGWIQHRGASGRLRVRAWDHDLGMAADITVEGVANEDEARGAMHGVLRASIADRFWFGLRPDWVSDGAYLMDLGGRPERVFAPHLRSRAWMGGAWRALHALATLDLLQPVGMGGSAGGMASPGGAAAVAMGLSPVRLLGPLYASADAGLLHLWPGETLGDSVQGQVTSLRLSPGLHAGTALLWFRLQGRAVYHLLGMSGGAGQAGDRSWRLRHALEAAAEVSLPLARTWSGGAAAMTRRHLVEPSLGVVWNKRLDTGHGFLLPGGSALLRGGHLRAGARTRLDTRSHTNEAGPRRRPLAGEASLYWPLDQDGTGAPLVGLDLDLSLRALLEGRLRLLWAPDSMALPRLEADACLFPAAPFRPCAGYSRLRLSGPLEAWSASPPGGVAGAMPGGAAWQPLTAEVDQVHAGLSVAFGPFQGRVLVAFDPRTVTLSHATGGVDLVFGCGCYRVGLWSAARAGQQWPDLGANLTLATPAGGRCRGL